MSFALASPPLEAPPPPKRAKSPPMAFERTPNDALAARISPPVSYNNFDPFQTTSSRVMSPNGSIFGDSPDLQAIIHKQSKAMSQLHSAFAAEREAWSCERESLYQRIASLEKLLMAQSGHSPAKSPIISPANGGSITSPPTSRLASASHRLPSIAEDENVDPRTRSSLRREGAPTKIEIPIIESVAGAHTHKPRNSSVVSFNDEALTVEEIPCLSPSSMRTLSPVPDHFKAHAGHTPIKTPARPFTPPAQRLALAEVDDTPTRSNTHMNTLIARSDSEDDDPALTGPLSMPELPNQPGEHNFTEEMLFKRLEHIAQSPGTEEARPLIFSQKSPGLATPEAVDLSPKAVESHSESGPVGIVAPIPTMEQPTQPASTVSPNSEIPLSQVTSNEEIEAAVQRNFDQGGIKLRKKASSNFGAPFGTLGGFGSVRRQS